MPRHRTPTVTLPSTGTEWNQFRDKLAALRPYRGVFLQQTSVKGTVRINQPGVFSILDRIGKSTGDGAAGYGNATFDKCFEAWWRYFLNIPTGGGETEADTGWEESTGNESPARFFNESILQLNLD